MEEAPNLLPSPAIPAPAPADVTPFIEVEETNESILICYEASGWIQFDENGVPHRIPMTRWSFEAALIHLAASTKPYLNFRDVYTQEHMEHVKTILRSCTHFKDVGFSNDPSPMNQHIINLVKKTAIEMENSNISVHFVKEFGDDESALYINVRSNGFRINCHILDPENIAYSHLLDFLKEISNRNQIVCIELNGLEFKDIFVELGWQYEYYMEENLRNGAASNVRLMNDNNVYCLEYWYHVERNLLNAHNADNADSDSGVSLQGDFFL